VIIGEQIGDCAFSLTSAVAERDADPRNLRAWPGESGLADGYHQRSTAKLPVERHPEYGTAGSRTTSRALCGIMPVIKDQITTLRRHNA
jgi:hypothetical protein